MIGLAINSIDGRTQNPAGDPPIAYGSGLRHCAALRERRFCADGLRGLPGALWSTTTISPDAVTGQPTGVNLSGSLLADERRARAAIWDAYTPVAVGDTHQAGWLRVTRESCHPATGLPWQELQDYGAVATVAAQYFGEFCLIGIQSTDQRADVRRAQLPACVARRGDGLRLPRPSPITSPLDVSVPGVSALVPGRVHVEYRLTESCTSH